MCNFTSAWVETYTFDTCFSIKQHSLISGRKCERRSLGVWLGRISCLFSALSGLHHYQSQQGVHTDSWEICSGVQQDHDECKKLSANYILFVVVSTRIEVAERVKRICNMLGFIFHSRDYSVHVKIIWFLVSFCSWMGALRWSNYV